MKICGLQKTTLLDYPGKVAATVFLGGCNFRCPFCHNSDLLTTDAPGLMSAEELLAFLRRRAGVLEGVCITGGEPTLWPEELPSLMRSIKELGYLVKLDTNGSHPRLLQSLCADGLADYVAMDIKSGRGQYGRVCGRSGQNVSAASEDDGQAGQVEGTGGPAGVLLAAVEESARWLMEGHVPYEFRTTAVKGIHTEEDFRDIAQWIGGCERYFLQGFVDSGHVLKPGFAAFSRAELEVFLAIMKETVPASEIRGVDY